MYQGCPTAVTSVEPASGWSARVALPQIFYSHLLYLLCPGFLGCFYNVLETFFLGLCLVRLPHWSSPVKQLLQESAILNYLSHCTRGMDCGRSAEIIEVYAFLRRWGKSFLSSCLTDSLGGCVHRSSQNAKMVSDLVVERWIWSFLLGNFRSARNM